MAPVKEAARTGAWSRVAWVFGSDTGRLASFGDVHRLQTPS